MGLLRRDYALGCPITRKALLVMNLSNEPLKALYALLPLLLYRELNATPLQISIFLSLRPMLSLLSFYWSSHLLYYKHKLLPNLIGAWVLARLPFCFLPLFPNLTYLFIASALFQLFNKAEMPAWIEIVKRKIPKKSREHLFSVYNMLTFLEGIGLSFIVGFVLDHKTLDWKTLFSLGALLGLISVIFQNKIPLPQEDMEEMTFTKNRIMHPITESIRLLKSRPDFAKFQWGFMLGGSALMLISPAMTFYYSDILAISYSNLSIARLAFMGIGIVLSSMSWKRALSTININTLVKYVLIGFILYLLSLLLAQTNMIFFYTAFFIYGVAQAGSQLLWNLSGAIFSGKDDSPPFSNVSILLLGVRGAIAPLLGGALCEFLSPLYLLAFGILILLAGLFYMYQTIQPTPSLEQE